MADGTGYMGHGKWYIKWYGGTTWSWDDTWHMGWFTEHGVVYGTCVRTTMSRALLNNESGPVTGRCGSVSRCSPPDETLTRRIRHALQNLGWGCSRDMSKGTEG